MATPVEDAEVVLLGISCPSTMDCTAVGTEQIANEEPRTVLLRTVNGTTWSSPSPVSERVGRVPLGVSCPAPAQCTAVGRFKAAVGSPAQTTRSLVLRET
jgi:hypothetical protein